MDPKVVCYCGHEREWHDSCSKCRCPFFIGAGATAAELRLWKRERKVRELREGKA